MTVPGHTQPPRMSLRPETFRRLSDLVGRESGLALREAKKNMIVARLSPRLSAVDARDFEDYCDHVESPAGELERQKMICVLTTNVTRFYRENHHFDALSRMVLPDLIKRAREGKSVRIWSAGCSTGQEAFSIAMRILELFPEALDLNLRILATDLDASCLATARDGVFPVDADAGLTPEIKAQFFDVLPQQNTLRVRKLVRDLVTFAELNLMKPWPMQGVFDVIFCRNVVIYFDGKTQAALWPRFAEVLARGGHLFIGHSERVHGPASDKFRLVGTTQYQRV